MRNTRKRSIPVLMLTLAFFAGLIYFTLNLVTHASEWASMPYNGHLSDSSGLEYAGKIKDRNGVVLAYSKKGKRLYNEDEELRRACLHVVGDDSVNISTAVQTMYRSKLSGYDFVFGLGVPDRLKKGGDITLTIDSEVQRAALRALGDYRGAVVVYNYKTGEILCLASTPTYDPMNKPEDIETNEAYEGAYLNRAISATYAPGSTFKLITAEAALEKDSEAYKREYDCSGSTEIGGKAINCYEVSGHIDMFGALRESCNAYFAELTIDLGKDRMTNQAQRCGFGKRWKFDGIETARSVYDVSQANDNEFAWSGVGQYTVLECPMNMAIRTSAIANGGVSVTPKLISKMDSSLADSMTPDDNSSPERMMSSQTAEKMKEMMDDTVANYYGKSYLSDELDVCAKTGTAEISDDGTAHAWVTGFTTDEDCPLVFAVLVERGNSGYQVAIPVASAVLSAAARSYRS